MEPFDGPATLGHSCIHHWNSRRETILWFGKFLRAGTVHVSLELAASHAGPAVLRISVAGKMRTATVVPASHGPTIVRFRPLRITRGGYCRIALRGWRKSGPSFGRPVCLVLRGTACRQAVFPDSRVRNAPSVHLFYQSQSRHIRWMFNQIRPQSTPLWTYYQACGFSRGYFGVQVNSRTRRQILFSVWDSGNLGNNRKRLPARDRVTVLARGRHVVVGPFGNEGTGLHAHLLYHWRAHHTYKFLVTAQPRGDATVYTGWFYFVQRRRWGLIARFNAPHDGHGLRGLYAFDEDFIPANGDLRRAALFGPAWIKSATGHWFPLTRAHFSRTARGPACNRLDACGGVVGRRFFLDTGGFSGPTTAYWKLLTLRDVPRRPPQFSVHALAIPSNDTKNLTPKTR